MGTRDKLYQTLSFTINKNSDIFFCSPAVSFRNRTQTVWDLLFLHSTNSVITFIPRWWSPEKFWMLDLILWIDVFSQSRKFCNNDVFIIFFLLAVSPAFEFYMPMIWNTLSHLHRWCLSLKWSRQNVAQCRHKKVRCRWITQKKEHNIQNKTKIWNQVWLLLCYASSLKSII
jgi:hypothetical protein